jgi:hypothetical protein
VKEDGGFDELFQICLSKDRAHQLALKQASLTPSIARDLHRLADGMLRHCVADLEHSDRGFTRTKSHDRVHVQDVERFIERCEVVLDLFFEESFLPGSQRRLLQIA